MKSYFTELYCHKCNRVFNPKEVQDFCRSCNRPLLARYDLGEIGKILGPENLSKRRQSLWRYRELLPVYEDRFIVTLGEGWTPVLRFEELGKRMGVPNLIIKDEGINPTGSFKARGVSVAVSKARELGIREACMPSAGNAGGALAAYAARAVIKAHVFIPRDTPVINVRETECYGAEVVLVDGVISDAAREMNNRAAGNAWFDMSTMKEPYRLEGKKTMGYEIAEQFNWTLPDVIVYPTGGGTGLIGMWKAFGEMETLGWLRGAKPKMVAVQTEGCAPIVRAFRERRSVSEFWEHAETVASGLRVPKAFADELILSCLTESGGAAVAVTDEDLLSAMRLAARFEGFLVCPETGAALAALHTLVESGIVTDAMNVLVLNTGSGYKYAEVLAVLSG